MPKNINAAYRVINIFNSLKGQGGRETYKVLGSAFKITGADFDVRREVMKRLPLLTDQIELILNNMVCTNYSENLYKNYLNGLIQWSNSFNLDADFTNYHSRIDGEVMLALNWCCEVLPNDEELIDSSIIHNWKERIIELLSELSSAELSSDLRQLLNKYLQLLRDALNNYQLVGLKTIEDSLIQTEAGLRRQSSQLNAELMQSSKKLEEPLMKYQEILQEVGNSLDIADIKRPADSVPLGGFSFSGIKVISHE